MPPWHCMLQFLQHRKFIPAPDLYTCCALCLESSPGLLMIGPSSCSSLLKDHLLEASLSFTLYQTTLFCFSAFNLIWNNFVCLFVYVSTHWNAPLPWKEPLSWSPVPRAVLTHRGHSVNSHWMNKSIKLLIVAAGNLPKGFISEPIEMLLAESPRKHQPTLLKNTHICYFHIGGSPEMEQH